jgi:hypothetical protein
VTDLIGLALAEDVGDGDAIELVSAVGAGGDDGKGDAEVYRGDQGSGDDRRPRHVARGIAELG